MPAQDWRAEQLGDRWPSGRIDVQEQAHQRCERVEVVGLEREALRAHLDEDAAKRPHVRLMRVRLPTEEFWRHVVRGAHHRRRQLRRAQTPCDTKVAELEQPGRRDEDVFCFQVAVQQPALVHMVQRQRQLSQPHQHLLLREEGPAHPRQLDPQPQIAAFAVLHHNAQLVPVHEAFPAAHDGGVLDAQHVLSFTER
eukprot:scaffold28837_cov116-Isochrysis_galbana.AAC.4